MAGNLLINWADGSFSRRIALRSYFTRRVGASMQKEKSFRVSTVCQCSKKFFFFSRYSEPHLRHCWLRSFHAKDVRIKTHWHSATSLTYTVPMLENSCLRSMKRLWQNKFVTCLIHCLYQNLKQFPRFQFIQSLPNIQYLNDSVSLNRWISKVISAH